MSRLRLSFGYIALLTTLISFCSFQPASASIVQLGDFILTLPDEITVIGKEDGLAPRQCTYHIYLEAKAGATIPLRASVGVSLKDSLGAQLHNGSADALIGNHRGISSVAWFRAAISRLWWVVTGSNRRPGD